MRYRLVTLIGFVIAVTAIAVTEQPDHLPLPARGAPDARLPKPPRTWACIEAGSPPGHLRPTGRSSSSRAWPARSPNLVGYYSGWAEPFNMSFAEMLHSHDAIPFVQIDPSFATVPAIAAGDYDTYLRSYADSVRDFGHAVVIGFGHEMNGAWYSWGYGTRPPRTSSPPGGTSSRCSVRKAPTTSPGCGPSTSSGPRALGPIRAWWPGTSYVTWVGIDGYYVRRSDTFGTVFGSTISQVRTITGQADPAVRDRRQPQGLPVRHHRADLFNSVQSQNAGGGVVRRVPARHGPYHQDWQIEGRSRSDGQAQIAFRNGIAGLNDRAHLRRPGGIRPRGARAAPRGSGPAPAPACPRRGRGSSTRPGPSRGTPGPALNPGATPW